MKRPSPEVVVFVFSVACIGTLLTWWTVFFRRITRENFELQSASIHEHLRLDQVEPSLRALSDQYSRLTLMVAGEGATLLICLLLCLGMLFFVAQQRQTAKERMQRMLALTTHELKTPIAGVRALIQSLQLGSIPEDQRLRLLSHGITECDRLEHLTETILAYQRTLRSAPKPLARVDLGELLAHLLEHRSDLPDSHVPAGLWVVADADAFRVIIENLLDNARKYGGGKAPNISHAQSPGYVRVAVSDRGSGFSPSDSERIFDVFSRGPGTTGQHGSGLGLFISRELAKQMGGTLVAHSDGPGMGATFTLELRTA
jgi:two-component system, OmpR family, sensor histidine kinase SenX3